MSDFATLIGIFLNVAPELTISLAFAVGLTAYGLYHYVRENDSKGAVGMIAGAAVVALTAGPHISGVGLSALFATYLGLVIAITLPATVHAARQALSDFAGALATVRNTPAPRHAQTTGEVNLGTMRAA